MNWFFERSTGVVEYVAFLEGSYLNLWEISNVQRIWTSIFMMTAPNINFLRYCYFTESNCFSIHFFRTTEISYWITVFCKLFKFFFWCCCSCCCSSITYWESANCWGKMVVQLSFICFCLSHRFSIAKSILNNLKIQICMEKLFPAPHFQSVCVPCFEVGLL